MRGGYKVMILAGAIGAAVAFCIFKSADYLYSQSVNNVPPKIYPESLPGSAKPKFASQIKQIVDGGLHWEQRVHAVRDLPDRLGDASIDRLFEYLAEPPLQQESGYLVCNEIMEVLRKRRLAPGVYTRRSLELIKAPQADPMIRDYAAQQLAQWISGMDPQACEADPEIASETFDSMCKEAINRENGQLTLAGTMLNALADAVINGNSSMQENRDEVGKVALSMLKSKDEVSLPNRATALQVAARLQVSGLSDICRQFATEPQTPPDLRLSSIAALGLVGIPSDIALLQSFASDQDYKFAAAAAVERLNLRVKAP